MWFNTVQFPTTTLLYPPPRLCIVDNATPIIQVEGFADYTDVSVEDLVPWTPLKTGYSGMDEGAALQVLSRVVPHFISIVTEEAKTLPDEEGKGDIPGA